MYTYVLLIGLARSTVADTYLVLFFFSGISNALRIQGGSNIYNVF